MVPPDRLRAPRARAGFTDAHHQVDRKRRRRLLEVERDAVAMSFDRPEHTVRPIGP